MKVWTAYIQKNGCNYNTSYEHPEVPVTDEQYAELQNMVKNNIPLNPSAIAKEIETAYYQELDRLFEERCNEKEKEKETIRSKWIEEHKDEEDFDEEEFEDYYEMEYEWEYDEDDEEWSYESFDLDDPNDPIRFKNAFVGKNYPNWQGKGKEKFEYNEDDFRIVSYEVFVCFDGKGTVTDVVLGDCEGLESETIKYTNTGEAYPNYELLTTWLENDLSGEE